MQSWGLLRLHTFFLADQKCLPVLPKTTNSNKNFQSFHWGNNQQERKAHHQHTCISLFFSQRSCRVPPSAQQDASAFPSGRICSGGAVLSFVYCEKNLPVPQLRVTEKLYYWSTNGFVYSLHVTVTETDTSIFLLKLCFPKMFCQGECTYMIIFRGPLNANACLAFLWPFCNSKIADPTPVNFLCK